MKQNLIGVTEVLKFVFEIVALSRWGLSLGIFCWMLLSEITQSGMGGGDNGCGSELLGVANI